MNTPAPFETITAAQLERVLGRQPYRYGRGTYRVRRYLRGGPAAVDHASEYAVAQRHPASGIYKLGVYDMETGRLMIACELERVR